MEKEIEGTKLKENSKTKKNIETYSDKTLCVPSTTIALKNLYKTSDRRLQLPLGNGIAKKY